jgi:PAS domain S-box-containing protein
MKEGKILNSGNNHILIIDDDLGIQGAYRMVLSPEPEDDRSSSAQLAKLLRSDALPGPSVSLRFDLEFASQGPEGIALVEAALERHHPFAAAFIDIRIPPGFDGMETAARIRRIDPDIEIVIVTAYSDRSREEIVRAVGAPEKLLFLRKPFDPEELIQMALSLTVKWNLARQANERKNELETVLMTSPAAIYTVDQNHHITSWNPAAEQITGYSAEQVLGQPCIINQIGTEKACGGCLLDVTDPSRLHLEIQIVDRYGVPRTLLKKGTRITDAKGRLIRLVESFWDITARKATEAALAESEARFRALVETTSDWVWETDASGKFTYCSPLCKEIYGYEPHELVGRYLFDLMAKPEEITEFQGLFNQCVGNKLGFHNLEHRSLTREGGVIHIETSGMPVVTEGDRVIGFRGIDRDVTKRKLIEKERQELEIQYRQSQKLEALGTLAGGIAHDLNNVLTPIMGGTQLSLLKLHPNHPIYDNLKTVEEGVQRAADLLHQILAFSRKQVMAPRPLNLTQLINHFSAMLRRLIREDIHLDFRLEQDLGTIEADKNQMEQVLINLVVNARDAVEEGGRIFIQTANRVVSKPSDAQSDRRVVPGTYVVMSVSDNGVGMDMTTVGRIFDPFYTTKEAGKGTGLGLSTVYGIVRQHGGEILVETAPGKGTRFDLYFKRTENNIESRDQEEPQTVIGGQETVLLVEDNVDVRTMTLTGLKHYGYRVIEAANGIEAIQSFRTLQGRIDLLFTDVVMPAMGGQTLAERLRELKPDLPVLFMSGHPFDVNTKKLAEEEGNDFIQKPFRPLEMAQKIRRMLDHSKVSPQP